MQLLTLLNILSKNKTKQTSNVKLFNFTESLLSKVKIISIFACTLFHEPVFCYFQCESESLTALRILNFHHS